MTEPDAPVYQSTPAASGGGAATGFVAVVDVLVCSIVDIRLVRPAFLLDLFHTFAGDHALTAFVLTLVATAVAHLMALVTPRPRMFFSWIVGLATVGGRGGPFRGGRNHREPGRNCQQ